MGDNGTRSRRLKWNIILSFSHQLTTIVCSFILPRLMLKAYGSDVNGLVNSIAQFLQIVGFLDLGVGAVVKSALYKPLADKNHDMISKIVSSAQRFFRKIAYIILAYIAVLSIVYPLFIKRDFGWLFTALLIVSMSISSFMQFYYGVVDSLLLTADQRGYIQYAVQMITIILNTVACAVLISFGFGIHMVKLTTSIIFLLRPIIFRWYVSKHYTIDRKVKCDEEPIAQKWNGLAQHIAAVVLDGTDIVVLTAFSTLSNVSVYSVYHLVINGVKGFFMSLTNGIKALIGELWAKQELDTLHQTFGWFEWILHTGTVFIFGCTGMLIVPFVSVYTNGVTDANYIQPIFAVLITLAHAGHCLRLPYSVMILAGGHYKQTQSNYIIAAAINIIVSITTVISFGLIGVAIGTLVAMLYQTVWMAHYISKNLNKWPFKSFIKQILVDALTVVVAAMATFWIKLSALNYLSWVLMAVEVAGIWVLVILAINLIFYRRRVLFLIQKLKRKRKSRA